MFSVAEKLPALAYKLWEYILGWYTSIWISVSRFVGAEVNTSFIQDGPAQPPLQNSTVRLSSQLTARRFRIRALTQAQQSLQRERPRVITYVPIPGSWRRRDRPNWPESAFQIPSEVPYGTIYYVTKGRFIGEGSTAHIEQLLSGHIVKYPKSNPYCQVSDKENRDRMRIEAKAYERIGHSPHIPKLIDWDPSSCCLTLEYLENGSLDRYIRNTADVAVDNRDAGPVSVPPDVRRRWATQAAVAVAVLHGADIIHCDVAPRNFLLDAQLDLRIADFAGCSMSGSAPFVGPGPRYQPPDWSRHKATSGDDVFALGSVLYFIMVGMEPYADLDEEEVESLFQNRQFPNVNGIACGDVIQGCWCGSLSTAEDVLMGLNCVKWEEDANNSAPSHNSE